MKNNKNLGYIGAFTAIIGMSFNKMPYFVVITVFSVITVLILYCIPKLYRALGGRLKQYWAFFGALISALMAYVFMFIDRTIKEFNVWTNMRNISVFCGMFFGIAMFIMIFIAAAPQIKKMGGISKASEELQPGSWFMMKICFWVVIIGIVGFLSIVAWEHFFE